MFAYQWKNTKNVHVFTKFYRGCVRVRETTVKKNNFYTMSFTYNQNLTTLILGLST